MELTARCGCLLRLEPCSDDEVSPDQEDFTLQCGCQWQWERCGAFRGLPKFGTCGDAGPIDTREGHVVYGVSCGCIFEFISCAYHRRLVTARVAGSSSADQDVVETSGDQPGPSIGGAGPEPATLQHRMAYSMQDRRYAPFKINSQATTVMYLPSKLIVNYRPSGQAKALMKIVEDCRMSQTSPALTSSRTRSSKRAAAYAIAPFEAITTTLTSQRYILNHILVHMEGRPKQLLVSDFQLRMNGAPQVQNERKPARLKGAAGSERVIQGVTRQEG